METSMPSRSSICQYRPFGSRCDLVPTPRSSGSGRAAGRWRSGYRHWPVHAPERIGDREAVAPRTAPPLRNQKMLIVIEKPAIAEPAAFAEMMPGRAVDRVVLARPGNWRQELGDHEAVGRLLDVFPERPPAKCEDLRDVRVGTIEQPRRGQLPGMISSAFR